MPRAKALYGGRNLQAIYTHLMEQPRLRRDQMQALRTALSNPRHDRSSSKEAIMRDPNRTDLENHESPDKSAAADIRAQTPLTNHMEEDGTVDSEFCRLLEEALWKVEAAGRPHSSACECEQCEAYDGVCDALQVKHGSGPYVDGYRILLIGETIQIGDEFNSGGQWVLTTQIGNRVEDGLHNSYRRLL